MLYFSVLHSSFFIVFLSVSFFLPSLFSCVSFLTPVRASNLFPLLLHFFHFSLYLVGPCRLHGFPRFPYSWFAWCPVARGPRFPRSPCSAVPDACILVSLEPAPCTSCLLTSPLVFFFPVCCHGPILIPFRSVPVQFRFRFQSGSRSRSRSGSGSSVRLSGLSVWLVWLAGC